MRRPRRLAAFVVSAVVAATGLLATGPRGRAVAAPDDPGRLATDLDDDRFEVRRAAERALETLGVQILAGDVPADRVAAWEGALDAAEERGGSPGAAARRILRRLETRADDEHVARMPRLLRARLERTLPQLVLPRRRGGEVEAREPDDVGFRALEAAAAAGRAVRGLLPAARPALLAIVARSGDARVVAGAVVALAGEDGEAPDGDDVVTALLDGYDRAPETMRRLSAWRGPGGLEPVAALALALAVTGRGADLARLRATGGVGDADVTLDAWLRRYVSAHGRGELGAGTFLVQVEEGTADAAVELEAARRALAADVPWLARMLARRALFLRPDDAAARAVLADAYAKVGMAATARDLRGEPRDEAVRDDPAAAELDASMREGKLSSRILFSRELGDTGATGLAPATLADGRVLFATTEGVVGAADATTGAELSLATTGTPRLPRAALVADGSLFVVTGRGELAWFALDDEGGLELRGKEPGPFLAATVGADGDVWLVAKGRVLYRRPRGGEVTRVSKVPSDPANVPRSLARTADGKLLLRDDKNEVTVVDPVTGAVSTLVRPEQAARAVAAFGREVLVAWPDGWSRTTTDGREVLRVPLEHGGDVVGIGGDPAAGLVVVVAPDQTTCFGADGTLRWQEQVGGSGNPEVRGDHVVVSAGTGKGPLGDGRIDRTIYVLRAGTSILDPFAGDARVRAVEAAVTAVVEDRDAVAASLVDPLRGWFTSTEAWGAETALREARQQREARKAPPPPRRDEGD